MLINKVVDIPLEQFTCESNSINRPIRYCGFGYRPQLSFKPCSRVRLSFVSDGSVTNIGFSVSYEIQPISKYTYSIALFCRCCVFISLYKYVRGQGVRTLSSSLVITFAAIKLQDPTCACRFKPRPLQKFETRFLLLARICSASGTTTSGPSASSKPGNSSKT